MTSLALTMIPVTFVVLLGLALTSVNVLRVDERGVLFVLGRFQRVKGPGLELLLPVVQEMVRVDLRIQAQNFLQATNMLAQTTWQQRTRHIARPPGHRGAGRLMSCPIQWPNQPKPRIAGMSRFRRLRAPAALCTACAPPGGAVT